VKCCFDAFREVGLRGVEPAVNILLPHVDSLLIKEHQPCAACRQTTPAIGGIWHHDLPC
jgi:hypothetical protein